MKYILLYTSVLLASVAQILLKSGVAKMGSVNSLKSLALAPFQPFVFAGLCAFGLSVTMWMYVLSKLEASYAYPLSALGYVFVAIFGHFFLNEAVNSTRIIGILIILFGVFVVSQS